MPGREQQVSRRFRVGLVVLIALLAPGLGEVRWDRFLSTLYAIGYDWVVSVEHEDRNFEGDLELVQRGFVLARNALRPLIV